VRAKQVWRLRKGVKDSPPIILIVKIENDVVTYNELDENGKKLGPKHPNLIAANDEYYECMCGRAKINRNYELDR